jgi:hypothetical protein
VTPARRQQALAIVAGLLVGGFLLDQLLGSKPSADPAQSDAPDVAAVGTPAPAGAPRDLDAGALESRYAAVVDEEPFRTRSFRPRPTPRARPSARPTRRREDPPPPAKLELRLTGLLGQGEGRVGVLEQRGSGKGILAHPGLELGELSVAAVHTASITIVEGESRRDLPLGEELILPQEFERQLVALKTTTTESSRHRAGRSPGGTQPAVEVSAEDRQKILERLRNRRRSSMTEKKPQEGGSQ